jgi:hypothetical protein
MNHITIYNCYNIFCDPGLARPLIYIPMRDARGGRWLIDAMDALTNNPSKSERRDRLDRRSGKMTIPNRYWLMGRRTAARREEDRKKSYKIDRHSVGTLMAILLIIVLSVLDATLTLFLVSHGATEVNPIMAYFLKHGPMAFFCAKYVFTCASVLVILVHTHYYLFRTRLRVKVLFVLVAIPLALVVKWELYLMLFIPR